MMASPVFRDDDLGYKRLRAEWFKSLNQTYDNGKGIKTWELDGLMLSSFRFCRYIKQYLTTQGVNTDYTGVRVPLLPEAMQRARDNLNQKYGIVSLFSEAESLEALSRSAFKWLKDNGKLVEPDGP